MGARHPRGAAAASPPNYLAIQIRSPQMQALFGECAIENSAMGSMAFWMGRNLHCGTLTSRMATRWPGPRVHGKTTIPERLLLPC
eukprot:6699740-Pyramimonas_sp.AAC.1